MKRKIIVVFLCLLVVCSALVAYYFGADINERLHPERSVDDKVELARIISEDIEKGEKSGVFYIKGMDIDDMEDINEYVCNLNGQVEKYHLLEKNKNGLKVRFTYNITDNYYVYRMYKYNEHFNDAPPTTLKLYEEVNTILSTVVKPGMTDYEKEIAIHDYIVENCDYGYTENADEYAYTSYGCLVKHQAVCNGYAQAMALLLKCADVDIDIITGTASGVAHAWNIIKLDGKYYHVDATWDDPVPAKGTFISHTYFNIDDEVMGNTHEWKADFYPKCESWDYNYFAKNNLIVNHAGFETAITGLAYKDINGGMEIVVTDYKEDYDASFLEKINGVRSLGLINEFYGPYNILTIQLNYN